MPNKNCRKLKFYLFIERNTSMSIEIPAYNYKEAEKGLEETLSEECLNGDWRFDSIRNY